MKIIKSQLKKIIKEEIKRALKEVGYPEMDPEAFSDMEVPAGFGGGALGENELERARDDHAAYEMIKRMIQDEMIAFHIPNPARLMDHFHRLRSQRTPAKPIGSLYEIFNNAYDEIDSPPGGKVTKNKQIYYARILLKVAADSGYSIDDDNLRLLKTAASAAYKP